MIALDNTAFFGPKVPRLRLHLTLAPLVGAIVLGALTLVLGAIVARGFSENGFRLGSQLAWRYTSFVFFAALAAGPACRIAARFFPQLTPHLDSYGRLSRRLVWGFCASYGVYLASVLLPNVIRLSPGATLMVLFGAGVTLMMAVAATPLKRLGKPMVIAQKVRRVLLATAATYFWMCYALMALARISGPHRPDGFYGLSLCLMVVALIVRFADRWLVHNAGTSAAVTAS